jgi:hypothetical protein
LVFLENSKPVSKQCAFFYNVWEQMKVKRNHSFGAQSEQVQIVYLLKITKKDKQFNKIMQSRNFFCFKLMHA